MCDYSLEMFQSRPAREDEEYVTIRFPTSSVGFVSPGDPNVAICMAYDSKLKLAHIPEGIQRMAEVGETEVVTFVQDEASRHRDCVQFDNGKVFTLQLIGPGVVAWLLPQVRLVSSSSNRDETTIEPLMNSIE